MGKKMSRKREKKKKLRKICSNFTVGLMLIIEKKNINLDGNDMKERK